MKLYNTLSKKIEQIKPIKPGHISLYTCGPTVYHYMHIGNLRKAIFDDLLKRTLLCSGYEVNHVMNITDVGHLSDDGDEGEDKLEKRSRQEAKTVWEIADYYTNCALADYDAVNFLAPDKIVKATDTINFQLEFVEDLEIKGYAYAGDLGVYFDTSKLDDYGKLTGQKLADKKIAARPDVVIDPSKRNTRDFALWVFTKGKHQHHSMKWDSKWGEGFPGWHLECSAIIKKEFGESIDIHTGGVDHIGTHHTNEIAQSEALNDKPLARHWMHSEFLLVDSNKMSKSLGNTYRILDLEERGFDRQTFRLLILQSHYRSQQNFTWEALKAAENRLIDLRLLAYYRFQPVEKSDITNGMIQDYKHKILDSMQNDLSSPEALSILSRFRDHVISSGIPESSMSNYVDFVFWLDQILGLDLAIEKDITQSQKKKIVERSKMREQKEWDKSDKIRDELALEGIYLEDSTAKSFWYKK